MERRGRARQSEARHGRRGGAMQGKGERVGARRGVAGRGGARRIEVRRGRGGGTGWGKKGVASEVRQGGDRVRSGRAR